jgi:hypothetical protein
MGRSNALSRALGWLDPPVASVIAVLAVDGGTQSVGETDRTGPAEGLFTGLPRRSASFVPPLKAPGAAGALGLQPLAARMATRQLRSGPLQLLPTRRHPCRCGTCRTRCVRIFSMTGRSRMTAMIVSSPRPQFGQCLICNRSRIYRKTPDPAATNRPLVNSR